VNAIVTSIPATQLSIKAAHIFLGFLVACAVAAIAFTIHSVIFMIASSQSAKQELSELLLGTIGVSGMLFMLICVVALPGFVLMRLILWIFKRTDWLSFAIVGALNGLLVASFFGQTGEFSIELFIKYPPSPIAPLIGSMAGAAACLTERYFARRNAMKAVVA
jgi:hypothetical protein